MGLRPATNPAESVADTARRQNRTRTRNRKKYNGVADENEEGDDSKDELI